MRTFFSIIVLLLTTLCGFAQSVGASNVEMADTLRDNGKIYTVVAVCLTILFGLFIYLFILERKLAKWEKNEAQ